MGQAVWTGSISFGLVSIPVKLYPATEPKDVRFHLYDRRTGQRVRYERVTRETEAPTFVPPEPGEQSDDERTHEVSEAQVEPRIETPLEGRRRVDSSDIVRGIELSSGDFVTVTDEELEPLVPERSRVIDIEEFVDIAEIDPIFFDKSYYVAPAWRTGAEKPYTLLLRAMQVAGMIGIGRFVLRTRPHLVAIRPLDKALALETLFFGDEIRRPEDVARLPSVPLSEREVATAQQLIAALATEWVPEKHADVYREELLDLLRSKSATPRAPAEDLGLTPEIDDLVATLRASVEQAKRRAPQRESRTKKVG